MADLPFRMKNGFRSGLHRGIRTLPHTDGHPLATGLPLARENGDINPGSAKIDRLRSISFKKCRCAPDDAAEESHVESSVKWAAAALRPRLAAWRQLPLSALSRSM